MTKYISKLSVTVSTGLFVGGTILGAFMYSQRSATPEKHVIGSNAITLHVLLALGLGLAIVVEAFYRRYSPKGPYSIWVAPFTKDALARVRQTVFLTYGRTTGNKIRAVVVGLLILLSLYYFFRAGIQVLAARDHNFTVNAWGGPSYLGAALAHWMDAAILFYVQAWIISFLVRKPKHTAKPKHRKRTKK